MSRLDELKRQRASVAQHLEWLDSEIAAEAARSGATVEPEPATTSPETPPTQATDDAAPGIDIPEEHAAESVQRVDNARRGCFVLFGTFLGVLALGTVLLYFLRYRH